MAYTCEYRGNKWENFGNYITSWTCPDLLGIALGTLVSKVPQHEVGLLNLGDIISDILLQIYILTLTWEHYLYTALSNVLQMEKLNLLSTKITLRDNEIFFLPKHTKVGGKCRLWCLRQWSYRLSQGVPYPPLSWTKLDLSKILPSFTYILKWR